MELLVHFVYSQDMYLSDLSSDAKFYLHSFNSFKMMVQNMVKFVPSVMEKGDIFIKIPYIIFSVIKRTVFMYGLSFHLRDIIRPLNQLIIFVCNFDISACVMGT